MGAGSGEEKYSCVSLLLSATWALTTRLRCSTSGTVLLTLWTDPFSLQTLSVFPSGYTTCPCRRRPRPCSRSAIAEGTTLKNSYHAPEDVTPVSDSALGAELQRAHRHSPARVPLHLLSALPARPTLHSHRQQHPTHHKRVEVSPPCPGVHGLSGGTHSLS